MSDPIIRENINMSAELAQRMVEDNMSGFANSVDPDQSGSEEAY